MPQRKDETEAGSIISGAGIVNWAPAVVAELVMLRA